MKLIVIIIFILIVAVMIGIKKRIKQPIKSQTSSPQIKYLKTYSEGVSKNRLEEIKNELSSDKRKYLLNCNENFDEYVVATKNLFSDIYKTMEKIDENEDLWNEYYLKVKQLKKSDKINEEIKFLEKAISKNIYVPYTYERLAILYGKLKNHQAAYIVCKKWFDTDYWKIPSMSGSSLKILDRMEKLKDK